MKTTKDVAELLSAEIERIGRGEVRKDVITGLERCSNALIKLARLEMDFAWKNWENQKPNVPWLATQTKIAAQIDEGDDEAHEVPPSSETVGLTRQQQDIEDQIKNWQKQLKGATPTMQKILTDKINHQQVRLARLVAMEDE